MSTNPRSDDHSAADPSADRRLPQSLSQAPTEPAKTDVAQISVRRVGADDMPAITAIYAYHVTHGTGTFEELVPSLADMAARQTAITGAGFPYLVAEKSGQIIGYAYAAAYRPRSAYRFSVEDSVYVHPDHQGTGVGRFLLNALIGLCEAGPWRQMVAVIGDSANAGSIGLHAALGFTPAGTLRNVGRKFDRWLDTVLMQRSLHCEANED